MCCTTCSIIVPYSTNWYTYLAKQRVTDPKKMFITRGWDAYLSLSNHGDIRYIQLLERHHFKMNFKHYIDNKEDKFQDHLERML